MLKHRIIPVLLTDGNGQCVKPVSFQRPYRKLGTMEQYIRVVENRNVDELIIIDIEATNQKRKPDFNKLRSYCDNLYCPVTYGGGISTLDDISMALNNGADKVAIRSIQGLIPGAVKKFGAQAIVYVMDWHGEDDPIKWAQYAEHLGGGEILLNDVYKDGTMEGYNLELIKDVSRAVSIPVIALGGCGEPAHMAQALSAGASAVAAGSMFLYTDYTPKNCAEYLDKQGFPVRLHE